MCPFYSGFDEVLQKQRCGDSACHGLIGDIAEMGIFAAEPCVIAMPEWQLPHGIADHCPRIQQQLSQLGVVGEQRRQIGAESDTRRTRQSRGIKQPVGLLFAGFGQQITQHQTSLGIGVAHLDSQPGARCQNVAGAHGMTRNAVFDTAETQLQSDREILRHDDMGQSQHQRRPAHILFHTQHAARRLDVIAARVETHALAHQ